MQNVNRTRDLRSVDLRVPRESPHANPISVFSNVRNAGNKIQINQRRGPSQAELHQRNEALASRECSGVLAQLEEKGNRFSQ